MIIPDGWKRSSLSRAGIGYHVHFRDKTVDFVYADSFLADVRQITPKKNKRRHYESRLDALKRV